VHNNASSPGDITLDYCCVSANGYGGETSRITETNTTNDDPQFIDEQGPDGQAGTGDEDLHLVDGSPCVDAGDNGYITGVGTDLDGNPRIVNATVDMGCYEKQ